MQSRVPLGPGKFHVVVLVFLKTMYDNTIIIIKFGFCDIQNNEGLGTSVISLGLLLG